MRGTRGNGVRSPASPQPQMDKNQVHPGAKWVLQPVRDGEWWNVVESNAALWVTAIHRIPTCRHPKGSARGGRPEDPSTGDRMELRPGGQRLKETYRRSCAMGTGLKFWAVS